MGLLTNRVTKESLKPGDHIYSWRTAYIYAHHGIYVGEDTVINFTRRGQEVGTGTVLDHLLVSSRPAPLTIPCPNCAPHEQGSGVISSCLNCFLAGGILCRFEYAVSHIVFLAQVRGGTCTLAVSDPADIVVHRAKYLLEKGFGGYNVFKNNCERFAIYCKTGKIVVDKGTIGLSGQASIVASTVKFLSSPRMRLATTNVCGIAVSAVVYYYSTRYDADVGMRSDALEVPVESLPLVETFLG